MAEYYTHAFEYKGFNFIFDLSDEDSPGNPGFFICAFGEEAQKAMNDKKFYKEVREYAWAQHEKNWGWFTAGPWYAVAESKQVQNANGKKITQDQFSICCSLEDKIIEEIARVNDFHVEHEANARLIAAAPDLFVAVQKLMEVISIFEKNKLIQSSEKWDFALKDAKEAGRDVIADVRGEDCE